MDAKKFAYYGGMLMLIMGVLSMIPGLEGSVGNLPALKLDISYARFLGIFPMNMMNKLALVGFGIAGVWVSKKYNDEIYSVNFSRVCFWVMGALAVLGLFDATDTLGGYWPLFGGEAAGHAFFALCGGYAGYIERRIHHQHHKLSDVKIKR
jgi:hypothetical protein